jgi:hypothetical protein
MDKFGKRKCNPAFYRRGKTPGYNPTITTCFGEQVNVDEMVTQFYKYYQVIGQWSDPIAESILFLLCRYYGPLPIGTEIIIVGGYAVRRVKDAKTGKISYQFKPYTWLTKEEREVRRNTIVKGVVTTFYKTREEHPLSSPEDKLTENDYWLYVDDMLDYTDRYVKINEAEQKQALTTVSDGRPVEGLLSEQNHTELDKLVEKT